MQVLKAAFPCKSLEEFAQRHISDVSSAGMFFRSGEPLEVGTRLRFEFTFADGEPLLDGQAVVVWVTASSGNPQLPAGMELRFEALVGENAQRFEWLQMVKRGAALALPTDDGSEQEPAAEVTEPKAAQQSPSAARSSIGRTASPHILDEYKEDQERAAAATAAPAPEGRVLERPVAAAPQRVAAAAAASDPDELFHSLAASSEPDLSDQRAMRRWRLLGLAGLVLVLGVGGAIAYRALRSSAADPPEPALRNMVRLTSDPAGAEVLVDGRTVGRTPLEAPVEPGSRLVLQAANRPPQEIALAGLKGWVREGDARVLNLIVQLPGPAAPGPATVRTWTPPEREACEPPPHRTVAVAAPRPARPAAPRPSSRDVGSSPDSRPRATDAAPAASRPSSDAAALEAAPPRPAGVKSPVWVDQPQNPPKN